MGSSLSRIHDYIQTYHIRWKSFGREISPTQPPDISLQLKEKNLYVTDRIRSQNLIRRMAPDPVLDRGAIGTGNGVR
jgi:hypothetical protein